MLLVAVGLNGTVAAVLRTGQITLITLALVLGALAFIAIRRAISATVLLLLAAMPKLWLAPMLTLLIHRFDGSRIALMLIGLGAVVGLMSLSAFVHPQFYEAFTETMRDFALRERSIGPENGSLQNLSITFFLSTGGSLQEARNWWAGSTLAITAVATVRFFQAIRSDRVELAYLFSLIALSLCLVSPRVMIYQWSIALPALAYVITYMRNRTCAHIILLLALVPTIYINRYVFGVDTFERIENALAIPWAFSNLLVVTLAWFALIVMWPRRTQATGLM
jgi:hypothetical protein